MARYQVILAYDGAEFSGYQKQARARTVQGMVEVALRRLGWQGQSILSAGRTDTGVHASGQVIAFDLEWQHPVQELQRALNAYLPKDVGVQKVSLTGPGFHPRFDAVARWYRYQLFCHPVRDPLQERYAWRVWPAVNLKPMQEAAGYLLGRHDFSAFGSPPHRGGSTVRTILHAAWHSTSGLLGQPYLIFDMAGDAFLYHMVRRTVSLLVEVGQGLVEAKVVQSYLDEQDPNPVLGLAPPHGLFLTRVEYPNLAEVSEKKLE